MATKLLITNKTLQLGRSTIERLFDYKCSTERQSGGYTTPDGDEQPGAYVPQLTSEPCKFSPGIRGIERIKDDRGNYEIQQALPSIALAYGTDIEAGDRITSIVDRDGQPVQGLEFPLEIEAIFPKGFKLVLKLKKLF